MIESIDCTYTIEGKGPALFMVHGIGARRSTWAGLVERLKEHFTCISYDLRGHGESPVTGGPFGLAELVADLERLRARLHIDKAHVIGHSLGGMIGPAYARAHPERVASVGLLSTAAFRTIDDSAKVRGVVEAMERQGIAPALDMLVQRWFSDDFQRAHPEVIERRRQQVLDTDAQVFLNVFRIYAQTEMSPWLHEVRQPCLVLTGEFDGGCSPRLNEQIAQALPDSELVILAGLKHAILLEDPERVAIHVLEFLQAHA